MYKVIKNKGKIVKAYQLGTDNAVIKALIKNGKIRDLGDGRYEIYSQEAVNGGIAGEIAMVGDWIKLDGSGFPYPNNQEYFLNNHRYIEKDTFEQLPKPLLALDAKLGMCPELTFLMEKKGLIIDKASFDRHYTAKLWGTTEVASADAMIVLYSVSYDEAGNITDCDWNFVERREFDKTYTMLE